MRRNPNPNLVQSGGGEHRHRAIIIALQNQCQRARPESGGKGGGNGGFLTKRKSGIGRRNMAYQWIKGWSLFGRKNTRNRSCIGGVSAKPINRFGWKSDKLSCRKNCYRLGNALIGNGKAGCHGTKWGLWFAGLAMRGIIAPDRGDCYPVIQHD